MREDLRGPERTVAANCGQILFSASKLDQVQWAVRVVDRDVIALLIFIPLLVIAALWLSRRAAGRCCSRSSGRCHLDLMRVAGGLVILLVLILDVSVVWLLVILALLAAREFWLYRIGAATRTNRRHRGWNIWLTHRGC